MSEPKADIYLLRRALITGLVAVGMTPVASLAQLASFRGKKMNALPPDIWQIPNLKATYSPTAIQVLVSTLLAMERIVSQESNFAVEKPIIGKMEYGYPKGPGGPLVCFFDSVKFARFGGSFRRKTDTSPWYISKLLIAERQDPHPINVTPAFYEHALGLVFEKSVRKEYRPKYDNDSENTFHFRSKSKPNIKYIFTAFLGGSSLDEHFPKNFFEVEIVDTRLEDSSQEP